MYHQVFVFKYIKGINSLGNCKLYFLKKKKLKKKSIGLEEVGTVKMRPKQYKQNIKQAKKASCIFLYNKEDEKS
jgi:hypothetical protein